MTDKNGLQLTEQPIEIFSQDRELIRDYNDSKENVPINECKVIFLGDPEAGKTHSIKRLLMRGEKLKYFDGNSTPGIEITVSQTKIEDTDIVVNYWDFGGTEIQHSMHRMFLTKNTVYVVFLNARQDPLDDRARYWMENVRSFAPDAPVLMVINKIDQNDRPKFNEEGFRVAYKDQIKDIVRVSALRDETDVFNWKLQGSINRIIKDLPIVRKQIPKSWKMLLEDIRTTRVFYLTSYEFKKKCEFYNIKNDNITNILDLFQEIGAGFSYYKDRSIADFMLLNPLWMVNALYTIIANSSTISKNGVITQSDLYDVLCNDSIEGATVKRVIPELRYKSIEVNYILGVTRAFRLSYPLVDGAEFFPMLCDGNEKISVGEIVSQSAYHHIFRYTFLPATVIHRLIFDMQRNIDYEYLWYSGFVLRNEERNQIAYLHILRNDLHIYIDSDERLYNLNEVLMPIRDKVIDINIELGLNAKEYVTYRLNGREAEFKYDLLLSHMKNGIYYTYNEYLDAVVDIRTILNRFDQVLRQKNYEPVETKPMPIGETDYESVINDFYYVDKTLLIKDVIDDHNKVYLFTRPRRFGKTLAMDMLYKFFDKTNNSINLFKERKIWNAGQKYRDYQGKYPVIYISFKDATANRWEDMYKIIYEIIWAEYERYEELLNSTNISKWHKEYILRILERKASSSELLFSLQRLSEMLMKHNNHKTIIIIDEYDTPIQSGFLNGFYNEVIGFIRTLFSSALKDNNTLEFGFLTGILRIAKESIFSGLNNVSVNTILDTKYSEYFGFTENEVSDMASYYGKTEELPEIREWYNGYYFGGTYIFNPWSVINYFDKGCTPEPYWGRTGTNQIISQIIHNSDITTKDDLSSLMSGQEIIKRIDLDIIYPEVNAKGDVLFSFLLVTGYLKIRKLISKNINSTTCSLRIPNLEIRKYFNDEIFKQLSTVLPGSLIDDFENALLEKDSNKLTETLETYLMNSASTFDTAHENFYHGTVYGMLAVLSERYYIKSNGESGEGRSDIQLEPRNKNDVGYIIEFKAGKGKTNDELVYKAKEAIKQIYNRQYITELVYHGVKEICLFGIAFSGKHVKVLREYVQIKKEENEELIFYNDTKGY